VPWHSELAVETFPAPDDQEYVYWPVPPAGTATALPSQDPLQFALLLMELIVKAGGWVRTTVCVDLQPLASLTVQVNVPEHNPFAVDVMLGFPDQEYE
jgi:hypothetical protein